MKYRYLCKYIMRPGAARMPEGRARWFVTGGRSMQQVIAGAQISAFQHPQVVGFILARRAAGDRPLRIRYVECGTGQYFKSLDLTKSIRRPNSIRAFVKPC